MITIVFLFACRIAASLSGGQDIGVYDSHNSESSNSSLPQDFFTPWDFLPPTSQEIFVLHITKGGGVSLVKDLSKIVGRQAIWSIEGVYSDRIKGNFDVMVTMLRNPRELIYSQYKHCHSKESEEVRRFLNVWNKNHDDVVHQSFETWVSEWAHMWEQGLTGGLNPGMHKRIGVNETAFHIFPFECYWPVNPQTRVFTSPIRHMQDPFAEPHLLKIDVDVEVAINNMMATDVVGLLEAYQESICLFHAVYQGILPRYCNCADPVAWSSFKPTHEDHGHGYYQSLSDYEPDVISKIDLFTAEDRILYNKAAQRFLRDIKSAEARFGMKILCHTLVSLA